jgi:ribosomal protein S27AE
VRPGEAVMKLVSMGYHFELVGWKVRYAWQGPGSPNAGKVSPLLDLVRQHKEDVRFFLKCYCPRCGGVVFCPDYEGRPICMACNWGELVETYPDLKVRH